MAGHVGAESPGEEDVERSRRTQLQSMPGPNDDEAPRGQDERHDPLHPHGQQAETLGEDRRDADADEDSSARQWGIAVARQCAHGTHHSHGGMARVGDETHRHQGHCHRDDEDDRLLVASRSRANGDQSVQQVAQ